MKLDKRLFYFKLTFIISLLFALLLSGRYVFAVNADTNSVENEDTVYIEKIEDFKLLSDLKFAGKMFLLKCDIDLSGNEWNPVDTYRMSGTFDGCGHTIKNFTVESEDKYTGFFSRNKLNIKNLFISSAFIKGGENSGVLAGFNLGDISNVHILGEITAQGNAGGLIAENYGCIDNCSFEGTVYGRKAGGLVALNESASLQNSYSKGKVSGHVIGGLISSAIQSNGSITEIKTSFSFSELIQIELSESAKRAGGFIGVRDNGITISNCFAGNDFPAISLGSFEGVKELNLTKREEKGTYSEFDFANYWNWDEELNKITQRTIAVSSNLIKLDGQQVFIVGNKNFYLQNEAVTLRLNANKTNPNIGISKLKVFDEDVTDKIVNFEFTFDLNSECNNITVDFDYNYLLKVEINVYDKAFVSLEEQTQYFAPEEELVFIVKEIQGYKNPALHSVFNGEEVVFTDISTEEDKSNEVQRFKAEINEQTYSANDMLYVSAVYEKVNNLWWILLLSIGLPLLICEAVVTVILIKRYKKGGKSYGKMP